MRTIDYSSFLGLGLVDFAFAFDFDCDAHALFNLLDLPVSAPSLKMKKNKAKMVLFFLNKTILNK